MAITVTASRNQRVAGAFAAVVLVLMLGGCGGGSRRAPIAKPRPTAAPSGRASVSLEAGRRLFVASGCGACHALRDAQTAGRAGPNFDTSEPLNHAQILSGLVEGANGMPSYAGKLSLRQRQRLADYIGAVAWHRASSSR